MHLMLTTLEMMHNLTTSLPLADAPSLGDPQMPPGFENFETIMGWGKWVCLALLMITLMFAGVRVSRARRREEDGGEEDALQVGKVLIGVMVVSAAGTMVGFLA